MTQRPTGPSMMYRGPDGPGPRRPRVRRAPRAIGPQLVLLGSILLFITIAYNGAIWVLNSTAPREVTVPKVQALRESEAATVLTTMGLKPEVVARKFDEKVPEGIVMSTDPEAGRRVKDGRAVRLTVSNGSRWTKVPEVRQMSVDRARALIKEAKLTVGEESAATNDKIPIGYVISQNPSPGKQVIRNFKVNLQLSRGPEQTAEEEPGQPQPNSETHSYDVEFVVPPGPSLQDIRIIVVDSKGEHEVYHRSHQVGETVRFHVKGEGTEAVVQVYDSGNLAEEHSF